MSARDDLLQRVRAARPADPDDAAAESIAVRTLARLAVLEAGHAADAARHPRKLLRLLRAAAVLVAVLLPLGALDDARESPAPTAAVPAVAVEPTWAARVERALSGDVLARERVLRGGLGAREALLGAAESGGAVGRRALELLRTAGPLRGGDEAQRVARLAHDPLLCSVACEVLARDMGAGGARHLGRLLASDPHATAAAVAALEQVARRGRTEGALRALLLGVREGRPEAAAVAVRIGGSTHLGRVLAALPEPAVKPAAVATEAAVATALREGAATLRARAVRLAERGNTRALRLAAAARIPGIVAVLDRETRHEHEARALAAVDLLADVGSVKSWVALSGVLGTPWSARATTHLQAAPEAADEALARHARRSLRDAPAALRALAARGSVERLRLLARESRLAPAAIHALGEAASDHAAAILLTLAARPSRSPHVLGALTDRLARGEADAGPALLSLARSGHERSVLTALARCGPPGVALLEQAAQDSQLSSRARHTLARLRSVSRGVRMAGRTGVRPKPARSI